MFYPDVPARLPTIPRHPLPNTTISGSQVETVRFLTDPQTFGGRTPTCFDTTVSHLVVDGRDLYILRKPVEHGAFSCATVHDRWEWCETQCMRGGSSLGAVTARPLPIAQREGRLFLGGPGSIRDWVLKITCESVIVEPGFITLRRAA
jgi:hypothetical protein